MKSGTLTLDPSGAHIRRRGAGRSHPIVVIPFQPETNAHPRKQAMSSVEEQTDAAESLNSLQSDLSTRGPMVCFIFLRQYDSTVIIEMARLPPHAAHMVAEASPPSL
jgi:hypothetical protein